MTKETMQDPLLAPEWQMDDAYGDIGSGRWLQSEAELRDLTERLGMCAEVPREEILRVLALFERAEVILSSMRAFVKCLGAKNSSDLRADRENGRLAIADSELKSAAAPLFSAVASLPEDDPLWLEKPLDGWKFEFRCRKTFWENSLSDSDRAWFSKMKTGVFEPLGAEFKQLQREVKFEARDSAGTPVTVRAAKMISILKGDPDPVLRETTGEGVLRSYGERSELYAGLLNALHGFRLAAFGRAGTDPLSVSLHQNRMSREALEAMLCAIRSRIGAARECVTLRADRLGKKQMPFWDLMAPAPDSGSEAGSSAVITYPEGMKLIRGALGTVAPALSEFAGMMAERGWIDAKPLDSKIGGAFYSRFNEFRIPRVFSTYRGNITSVIQQSHEIGHAFHYWVMRDLPAVETEFPMTLTETASTFNEAVLRRHLYEVADDAGRFAMRWQDLRSWANFLLNTTARMSFELAFLEERRAGTVSGGRCCELMEDAWRQWYGDTASPDRYLWAHKLHFYKTDQLIYNYPYTVGFLLSQILSARRDEMGGRFYPFYIGMLRDTGRMTVDGIVAKHFGGSASDPEFWLGAMAGLDRALEDFRSLS